MSMWTRHMAGIIVPMITLVKSSSPSYFCVSPEKRKTQRPFTQKKSLQPTLPESTPSLDWGEVPSSIYLDFLHLRNPAGCGTCNRQTKTHLRLQSPRNNKQTIPRILQLLPVHGTVLVQIVVVSLKFITTPLSFPHLDGHYALQSNGSCILETKPKCWFQPECHDVALGSICIFCLR